MTDIFFLIDTRKNPTREESTTQGKEVGHDFLKRFLNERDMNYGGYIVQDGQFAPFWRIFVTPVNLVRSLHDLNNNGYIGKIRSTIC